MSISHPQSPQEGRSFAVRNQPPGGILPLAAAPFTIVSEPWTIVLLTLLVLLAVSPGLRQFIAELPKALREIKWGEFRLLFR